MPNRIYSIYIDSVERLLENFKKISINFMNFGKKLENIISKNSIAKIRYSIVFGIRIITLCYVYIYAGRSY